ncbi:hypothetical protein N431DRAFT_364272, partial [Stipitochalara longipes BDJ]
MHSSVSSTTDAYSPSKRSFECSSGLPNSPVCEPTTIPRAPPSPSQAAFICTICWQHQPPGAKPKLLGTSARIVCHACWRAVLDLSICWVCGECIVRGDEVVSLGWCFWHRGCFGCLICRTRMSVSRLEAGGLPNHPAEWGRWGCSGDNESGKRRDVGIELDTIPLCNVCTVETAAESQNQVLERGLECVSIFDGGLSRDRWVMLTELAEEREGEITLTRGLYTRSSRRLRGATGIEQDLKRYINGSSGRYTNDLLNSGDPSSLLENAADMGKISDGTIDEKQWHSDRIVTSSDHSQETEEQSDVYVSVLDPVGEPAFKPSKFKPLPSWMNLLPNNVHRERGQKDSIFLKYKSEHQAKMDLSMENKESGSNQSSEDSRGSPVALVDIPNFRGGREETLSLRNPEKSRKQRERRAVSYETTYVADNNRVYRCPRAFEAAADAANSAPSDYLSYDPQPLRRRNVYPLDFPRFSTLRKDANADFRQGKSPDVAEEPTTKPCCELGSRLQQRHNVHEDRLLRRRRERQASSQRLSLSLTTSS